MKRVEEAEAVAQAAEQPVFTLKGLKRERMELQNEVIVLQQHCNLYAEEQQVLAELHELRYQRDTLQQTVRQYESMFGPSWSKR